MSKMTKTQVQHLKDRLNIALTNKSNELFARVPVPNTQDEIEKLSTEYAKALKIDYGTHHYTLRNLASDVVRRKTNVTQLNKEVDAKRREYTTGKQAEINQILDEAILGDSTEALEALKSFQKGL